MSGIWVKSKDGWKTAASQKFGLEKDLHELAEENIHMLPVAGSPNLVVIGSEVSLGSGWADLLAVETTGRPVIIEVKLARNAGGPLGGQVSLPGSGADDRRCRRCQDHTPYLPAGLA